MLPSVEARWFMRGTVPKEALDWIQRWECAGSAPEERDDHYLCLPGATSLGVKLRDGRFEVKRRDIDMGLVPLGDRVAGRLALWRKWSFKLEGDSGKKAPDGYWITIEKERYLRKYEIVNDSLKAVEPNKFPVRGCTVELTQLQVRGTTWWSLGFEAFGPHDDELRSTLTLVAEKCFTRGDHPTLDSESSFDYPEWLVSLCE